MSGEFIILIDTSQMSKEKLLQLMKLANGMHITPTSYPSIFPEDYLMSIALKEIDYGVGSYRLTRAQLTHAVKEELRIFATTPGVKIECNGIVRPMTE